MSLPNYLECKLIHSQKEGNKIQYPNGLDLSLPINSDKARTLMKYDPNLYDISMVTDEYYRFFEVAVSNWLTRGNTSYNHPEYNSYRRMTGGRMDTTSDHSNIFQGNITHVLGNPRPFSSPFEINYTFLCTEKNLKM